MDLESPSRIVPKAAAGASQDSGCPRRQWSHYYIRCINGEVRLWVNDEEVSGGTACLPSEGFLGLESEGSPMEFKNLRIRELP